MVFVCDGAAILGNERLSLDRRGRGEMYLYEKLLGGVFKEMRAE